MKFESGYLNLLSFILMVPFVASTVNANTPIVNELKILSGNQISVDTVFNFNNQKSGVIPAGWTNVSGNWILKQVDNNKVVAQMAENKGMEFNVAIFDEAILKDVELSVDIRAIAGEEDQGGGLVWRYMDSNNYYIVRFNPLEDNLRLYKVLKGSRMQLVSTHVTVPKGSWFNIKVVMKGTEIVCYFNEKELISRNDDTFVKAGKTGFWTKADAVSDFDNLKIKGN